MGTAAAKPIAGTELRTTSAGGALESHCANEARAARSPVPLRAFVVSRLLVLAAGMAGAGLGARVGGWQMFDPAMLSTSFGGFGNLLAAPAVRWDAIHYLSIAGHGYAAPPDTAFFPLYPLLIHLGSWLTGSAALAAILISAGCFALALVLLHRLTELELGRPAADATVVLLAFAPLSFFFTAVYTESLFLALSVATIYAARREHWALAGGLGALAALTRVTGVLLVIPMAAVCLRRRRGTWRRLVSILAPAAALIGYLGFLGMRGFGWLAPLQQQAAVQHLHRFTGPIDAMLAAIHSAAAGAAAILGGNAPTYAPSLAGALSPSAESVYLFAVGLLAVFALAAGLRSLPRPYTAYALAVLIVCIASPVAGQPLKSLDRYVLTIFPLWMAAGRWASQRRLVRPLALAGAALLALFAFSFANWAWIA